LYQYLEWRLRRSAGRSGAPDTDGISFASSSSLGAPLCSDDNG
jgi:hypothetical protein